VAATNGTLLNQETKEKVPYQIIALDISWKEKLIAVQDEVYTKLERKDLYIKITEQEFEEVLGGMGIVVGAVCNGQLVGFHVSSYHDTETKELGKHLNLNSRQLEELAYIEASVVLPEYRGNGLQKIMISENIKLLKDCGFIKHLVTTIAPDNIPSLKSLQNLGFFILNTKEITPGCIRHILYRKLKEKI